MAIGNLGQLAAFEARWLCVHPDKIALLDCWKSTPLLQYLRLSSHTKFLYMLVEGGN
jgi:hypothetical protein